MKACVFTLGCKVNEAESASLMAGLEARGYAVVQEQQVKRRGVLLTNYIMQKRAP